MGIRLAFMGSAPFALPSLTAAFESGVTITGVITQPDKPSGRGQQLQGPPVKKRAQELHLPVYQPPSLRTDEARELVRALAPDLIAVVAYGKILPPWLLAFPRFGCINVHASLLPKFRGAAPVHWAILAGEQKTGVCTMLLNEGLDTGPVYLCEETAIGQNETVTQLYGRLAEMGAPLLLKTIEGITAESLRPQPQDDSKATLAPPLKKEDGFLSWERPAQEIHNRVRALNPWPGTVSKFRSFTCKILETALLPKIDRPETAPLQLAPGSIVTTKSRLTVICGDGLPLEILSIQPQNRKSVLGRDFANGAHIQAGEKFLPLKDN